jgi:hypothetical protein
MVGGSHSMPALVPGAPPQAQHQQVAPPPQTDMVAQAVAMKLGQIAQQQAWVSQQIAQASATTPNFHGSPLQRQLFANLALLQEQQAALVRQSAAAQQAVGVGGGQQQQQQQQQQQHAHGAAYSVAPRAPGGDYSQDAAYRQMVALQAQQVQQAQRGKAQRGGKADPSGAGPSQEQAAVAGSDVEAAHELAHAIAPTYAHNKSEDVELGGMMMSMVKEGIKSKFGRKKKSRDKETPRAGPSPKRKDSPKAKKGKEKKATPKKKGGAAPSEPSSAREPAPSDPAPSNLPLAPPPSNPAPAPDVNQLLLSVLTSMRGRDARVGRELFTQLLMKLNNQLGRPSSIAQIDLLFQTSQQGGLVDLNDFLRRDTTRNYFLMTPLDA